MTRRETMSSKMISMRKKNSVNGLVTHAVKSLQFCYRGNSGNSKNKGFEQEFFF